MNKRGRRGEGKRGDGKQRNGAISASLHTATNRAHHGLAPHCIRTDAKRAHNKHTNRAWEALSSTARVTALVVIYQ